MAQLGCRVRTQPDDPVEVPYIMRALDPEVFDAVWTAVEPLVPEPATSHPLGCHRRRISNRICLWAMLVRLVTGCLWVDAERLVDGAVSDTTLRARRDEWERAGVFGAVVEEALCAYDKIIGLDLSEVAIDASQHKAPRGGEGTGPNHVDRGKCGWKWSLMTDRSGIPLGWATNGAHRHDVILFEPTLADVARRGLVADIETLHLDRGYDSARVRDACADYGIGDLVAPRQRQKGKVAGRRRAKVVVPLGLRWPVERTNAWLANFGQLRRNTDRTIAQRLGELALAIIVLITAKLIDWRNRWCRP
jgi:transposase